MPNPAPNQWIVQNINYLFSLLWPVVVAAVIIFFGYAGFEFLTAQGDDTKLTKARQALIWGTIGVAVVIIGFSIVQTLQGFLGAF